MKTFVDLLTYQAKRSPKHPLFFQKRLGLWHPFSTANLVRNTAQAILALDRANLPVQPIFLFGKNCIEFITLELACHATGRPVLLIPENFNANELMTSIDQFDPAMLVCSHEEQLDTVGSLAVPYKGLLINLDKKSLSESSAKPYHEVIALAELPSYNEAISILEKLKPENQDTFYIHSAGKSNTPHFAGFSQESIIKITSHFTTAASIESDDTLVSFMPPGLYMERIFCFMIPLLKGCSVYISEREETFFADMKEVSPTVFIAFPKIFTDFRRLAGFKISLTSLVRQFFWDYFYKAKNEEFRFGEEAASLKIRIRNFFFERLFLRALRNRLGLLRCRLALSSGGELNEEAMYWFHCIGVPVYEFYGTCETGGQGFFPKIDTSHLSTSGTAMPDVQCMLDDQGQIMLSIENAPFLSTIHKDVRVIATADIGYLDRNGRLKIIENSRNMLETDDGIVFSIRPAEEKLRENQYIREVFCLNTTGKGTTAYIEFIPERVRDEIRRDGRSLLSYSQLSTDEMAIDFFRKELKKENEDLVSYEKITQFALLPEPLDEYKGELAYDLSPRRGHLEKKTQELPLYGVKK